MSPTEPAPGTAIPWTLRAAATVVAAETLVECAVVAARSELTPGLRGMLILCLGLKWVFAWRVLGLHAGAVFGLLMLEGTTIVAAFGAVDWTLPARLALGGTALVATALLLGSLQAFPSPTLPKP
jgi:hypothetical protein